MIYWKVRIPCFCITDCRHCIPSLKDSSHFKNVEKISLIKSLNFKKMLYWIIIYVRFAVKPETVWILSSFGNLNFYPLPYLQINLFNSSQST